MLPKIYSNIAKENDFDRAVAVLEGIYVKPRNIVAARGELRSCKQQLGKTIDQFVLRLEQLSDFQNVISDMQATSSPELVACVSPVILIVTVILSISSLIIIICNFLKNTLKLLISSKYSLSGNCSGRPSGIGWVFRNKTTRLLFYIGKQNLPSMCTCRT